MSKKNIIFFLRHGKPLLPYRDHSEMPLSVLVDLASGRLDPPIDKVVSFEILKEKVAQLLLLTECQAIYTSPSQRCKSTSELISSYTQNNFQRVIPIITKPEIKEVMFDLDSIVKQSHGDSFNMQKINQLVFRAISTGINCESFIKVWQRVEIFINFLPKNDTAIVLTHDFYLRVVEIFFRQRGQLPPKITPAIFENTRRNGYLSGFKIDWDSYNLEYI